jgi:hypothetical protein
MIPSKQYESVINVNMVANVEVSRDGAGYYEAAWVNLSSTVKVLVSIQASLPPSPLYSPSSHHKSEFDRIPRINTTRDWDYFKLVLECPKP